MDRWIGHIQRYIGTGFREADELQHAIKTCSDLRICAFLWKFSVGKQNHIAVGLELAEALKRDGQTHAELSVRWLAGLSMITATQSPLAIDKEQRLVCFNYSQSLINSLRVHNALAPSMAMLSRALADGLAALGSSSEDARLAYTEVLALYRSLAKVEPAAYQPEVAMTLNNLAGFLCRLHDYPAAQAACEEALTLYRTLARAEPAVYQPNVAMTLHNLAALLSDMRDHVTARVASEEALGLYRLLVKAAPAVYQPNVAGALNNLAALLHDLRDYPAARNACEEALELYRPLAKIEPAVYQPDVAMTLNNLTNLLRDLRDYPAAQAACEEALTLYRTLARAEPAVYQPNVAMTLHNLAALLSDIRDFPAARGAYEEALDLYRSLVKAEPAVYQPNVAMTLNNLAALLRALRDYPAARATSEEALELYRTLARAEPAVYQPNVAMTLNNLAALLRDLRDYPAAQAACEEALTLYRTLARAEPAVYQPNVAMTLHNLTALLLDLRDYSSAGVACEEALTLYRSLAKVEPAVYQPDVAMTLTHLARLWKSQGELPAARAACEEVLGIYRTLAMSEPLVYQPDVAMTLNNLADLLADLRDYPTARATFEEALGLFRTLAKAAPTVYQPNVAMTLNNLAALLSDMRDYPAARAAYEEAVEWVEADGKDYKQQHLIKNKVEDAYRYLLRAMTLESDNVRSFALAAAMRGGGLRAKFVLAKNLSDVQSALSSLSNKTGILHQLVIPTRGPDDELLLGLINASGAHFFVVEKHGWGELFPSDRPTSQDQTKRHTLARALWHAMPSTLKDALIPCASSPKMTVISADPFWSAFPWELLRFGEGVDDYLGLHQALPRIGSILSIDIEAQCADMEQAPRTGSLAVLAPHDTALNVLEFVPPEVRAVRKAVENRNGEVLAFSLGSEANQSAVTEQLKMCPDIWYYSGHGTIVQNEELLVLHSGRNNAFSSKHYFGKSQLIALSEQQKTPLFAHHPLVVLNSCLSGRSRNAGGKREDLVSTCLALGAGAVIASALPIYDFVGKAFGESLLDERLNPAEETGSAIVNARRYLAAGVCADPSSPLWGAWAMIHLHGSAHMRLPFSTIVETNE